MEDEDDSWTTRHLLIHRNYLSTVGLEKTDWFIESKKEGKTVEPVPSFSC